MKNYPDGNVEFFWLMSVNGANEPATKADIAKWDETYKFGDHGRTLVDAEQAGFKALFKDTPGTDGAMVLERGTIINKTPKVTDPNQAIKDALK